MLAFVPDATLLNLTLSNSGHAQEARHCFLDIDLLLSLRFFRFSSPLLFNFHLIVIYLNHFGAKFVGRKAKVSDIILKTCTTGGWSN